MASLGIDFCLLSVLGAFFNHRCGSAATADDFLLGTHNRRLYRVSEGLIDVFVRLKDCQMGCVCWRVLAKLSWLASIGDNWLVGSMRSGQWTMTKYSTVYGRSLERFDSAEF